MSYWSDKVSLFLHDPVDKALGITGHEKRAAVIAKFLSQAVPARESYSEADRIASGLARAALPGYSEKSDENGSVNFVAKPELTHPLVEKSGRAGFRIPGSIGTAVIQKAILDLLDEDINKNLKSEWQSIRNSNGSPMDESKALYFYLFFSLRKRLQEKNVGGLGGLWGLLPADTRMPDHSIWQHAALTSATGSSMAADSARKASLVVFSITPVQPFIAKARKLRDLWVGSVILSYLSFIGIKTICSELGPDHIMYPSLQDQNLVEAWIGNEFHLESYLEGIVPSEAEKKKSESIASFPNKFVFMCGSSSVASTCEKIIKNVNDEWLRIAGMVGNYLVSLSKTTGDKTSQNPEKLDELFKHQISDYWEYNYSASRLIGLDDLPVLRTLVSEDNWKEEKETQEAFSRKHESRNMVRLYGATHSLIQSLLASTKLKPSRIRKPQDGEKCPLCGEHEVLHGFADSGKTGAEAYKDAYKAFWNHLRAELNADGSTAEIGEAERLCAVCSVKRLLPRVIRSRKEELLHTVLEDARFPSTTGMATIRYVDRLCSAGILKSDQKENFIQSLHQVELETDEEEKSEKIRQLIEKGRTKGIHYTNTDRYYALLLMDGDKMGDLVNGVTITATWKSVIHSDLVRRYQESTFKPLHEALGQRLQKKRTLSPTVHATISDALNNFARFGVGPIVSKYDGRLIYAGGDDVCAILPLDTVLNAAEEIKDVYGMSFVRYTESGAVQLNAEGNEVSSRLGIHPGKAEGISISAAVIVAHHKTPLRETIQHAHAVLGGIAKERSGRNSIAIRLRKRSGGDRDFWCGWDEPNPFMSGETVFESFCAVMKGADEDMSTRLIYKLENLKNALPPLWNNDDMNSKEQIVKLFAYEAGHSGSKGGQAGEIDRVDPVTQARRLAGICIRYHHGNDNIRTNTNPDYNPEAAVIARFLPQRQAKGGQA